MDELKRYEMVTAEDALAALDRIAARMERLEGALQRIVSWSEAYPLDLCPEARHVVEEVGEIARGALKVSV